MTQLNLGTQKSVRDAVVAATGKSAKNDGVAVSAESLAFTSDSLAMLVNAPISGLETLDFPGLLNGGNDFGKVPVMYWFIGLEDEIKALPKGFYTVMADTAQGASVLLDGQGKKVAEGDLGVSAATGDGVLKLKVGVEGKLPTVEFGKGKIKICGEVTVKVGPGTVKVNACVEVKY